MERNATMPDQIARHLVQYHGLPVEFTAGHYLELNHLHSWIHRNKINPQRLPDLEEPASAAALLRAHGLKVPRPSSMFGAAMVRPEPPPLTLTPGSARAIVTVAVGDEGRKLLELSRPWMTTYATRLGADFVVLDWLFPEQPMYSKFQLHRVLDHYERVIFLDADTLADPVKAPDLFALVQPGEFGIYDDWPAFKTGNGVDGFNRMFNSVRASQGWPPKEISWYGNTGVMVFDRSHKPLLAPPALPIPKQHVGEQNLWLSRVLDAGVPILNLDSRANRQWWEFSEFKDPQPDDSILHFSGMRPRTSKYHRLRLMSRFAGRPWLKVIATGSGRTGTFWMAKLLTACGLPCGHESVFDPNEPATLDRLSGVAWPVPSGAFIRDGQRHLGKEGLDSILADSAWEAAVYIQPGNPAAQYLTDVPVIHCVRDPVAAIDSSLNRIRWYRSPVADKPFMAWRYNVLPELKSPTINPHERAVLSFVRWNRMIETVTAGRRTIRFRVDRDDPEAIAAFVGGTLREIPDKTANTLPIVDPGAERFDPARVSIPTRHEFDQLRADYGYG